MHFLLLLQIYLLHFIFHIRPAASDFCCNFLKTIYDGNERERESMVWYEWRLTWHKVHSNRSSLDSLIRNEKKKTWQKQNHNACTAQIGKPNQLNCVLPFHHQLIYHVFNLNQIDVTTQRNIHISWIYWRYCTFENLKPPQPYAVYSTTRRTWSGESYSFYICSFILHRSMA